jgi:hypothetical protein
MGSVAQLSVPLSVEVGAGANWDKAHEVVMKWHDWEDAQ